MLKKTMTYTDFDGVQRTEDFYFNLTKAEVLEMEMSYPGGLGAYLRSIVAANNVPVLMDKFKWVIEKAYGVRSPDGKRFIKNPEVLADFTQTEAYSDLFVELATNAASASAFINAIVPKTAEKPVLAALPGGAE
jgi:hypothetical protein